MKLTEKQKRFVDYYLETGNATEAARRAGYSVRTAHSIADENLKKPAISQILEKRLKEMESARIAQASEVLQYLTSVMRGKSTSEVVVVEATGDFLSKARHVKKAPDEKEQLRAAELLAKRYRLLTDNFNLDGNFQINFTGEENLAD